VRQDRFGARFVHDGLPSRCDVPDGVCRSACAWRGGILQIAAGGALIEGRGELQKLRMLRRCCCATAVPILPGDVPMTADGLRANEFLPYGRHAQSIAFFNAPGMDRLYSGVTNNTASTAAIAFLNAVATGG
jgi:hypothetical protein